MRQPVFLARNYRRVGYRNLIPHKKYQTKPKPLRYKAGVYPSPVTMGIHITSPEIRVYHSPVTMGIHTTSPETRAYHSPVTMGIPQVPLSRAYHKSRYHGHLYHKSRNKGIPQVPLPWAYHIEYRYSSYFSHMVFYRFNKVNTITIIMKYGVYGLASGVIGECCFIAPSATRI